MRAVRFHAPGDAREVLRLEDVAEPSAKPGEVVVAVEARPINPSDLFFIQGRYRIRPQLPQIAGLEGAGRVVAAGAGTEHLLDKRVAFRWPGAWAERTAVPTTALHVVPDGVDAGRAAQFSLNPVTAWALLDELSTPSSDFIALTAGRSSVSRVVATLARERGLGVIAIVRRGADESADRLAIVGDGPNLEATIRNLIGEERLAGLLDSVGGPVVERLFPLLSTGATVVAYGTSSNAPIAMRNATLIYANLTWKGFGIDYWLARAGAEKRARMAAELWARIESGAIDLPVDSRFALTGFRQALDRAVDGALQGKVLLES
jgi:NADPH:quinone reductase-like Zn-dependent oxidoreductase